MAENISKHVALFFFSGILGHTVEYEETESFCGIIKFKFSDRIMSLS